MIVLGIDPGTRHLGWGVVRRDGTRPTHVAHGVIDTDVSATIAVRLCQIESELTDVIARFQPTASVVEALFFAKDASAAAKLGHARGVVLLLLARAGVEIAEYPPAQVKKTIAGSGQARSQVAIRQLARRQLGTGTIHAVHFEVEGGGDSPYGVHRLPVRRPQLLSREHGQALAGMGAAPRRARP